MFASESGIAVKTIGKLNKNPMYTENVVFNNDCVTTLDYITQLWRFHPLIDDYEKPNTYYRIHIILGNPTAYLEMKRAMSHSACSIFANYRQTVNIVQDYG